MRQVPSPAASAAPLVSPLHNCYWVLPGELLAGEHPCGSSREETQRRVKWLLDAGVECFLDLTHPGEREPYDAQLPANIEYLRRPIRDHGLPEQPAHMREILDCLHEMLQSGRKVYVHCHAGIGRTGMVAGCLLVERGLSGDAALEELNRLWRQSERSSTWDFVPETHEQGVYVREWTPAPRPAVSARRASGRPPQDLDPLLDESTLAAAQGLRGRFLGVLLGLAVGDALAAPTQFRRPGTFTPVGDLLGGGPFDLPRGGWSDDTAMALCLAESLLECNGFDSRDQVSRYCRWQREGYLSATGQCIGITASTARALAVAQWRRQAFSGSHDPGQLDPEPLSRVGAATLFYFASPAEAFQQATESARATCQAPPVLDACRELSQALHAALSGQPKKDILAGAGSLPRSPPAAPVSAPEVLAAALWSFGTTDHFREAVLQAVNLGGNSDVTASVCGQLAGAYYSVAAIPAAWRASLLHRDLIEGFADRLLAHALVSLGSQP